MFLMTSFMLLQKKKQIVENIFNSLKRLTPLNKKFTEEKIEEKIELKFIMTCTSDLGDD